MVNRNRAKYIVRTIKWDYSISNYNYDRSMINNITSQYILKFTMRYHADNIRYLFEYLLLNNMLKKHKNIMMTSVKNHSKYVCLLFKFYPFYDYISFQQFAIRKIYYISQ